MRLAEIDDQAGLPVLERLVQVLVQVEKALLESLGVTAIVVRGTIIARVDRFCSRDGHRTTRDREALPSHEGQHGNGDTSIHPKFTLLSGG